VFRKEEGKKAKSKNQRIMGIMVCGILPRELRKAIGARSGDVPYLLGGWGSRKDVRTGRLLDGPQEKWKPDMEAIKATIRFSKKQVD
jgi:hypothetical protein